MVFYMVVYKASPHKKPLYYTISMWPYEFMNSVVNFLSRHYYWYLQSLRLLPLQTFWGLALLAWHALALAWRDSSGCDMI